MKLEGKVCVVTGGASGIGQAIAQALQAAGAGGIVVADLDLAKAEDVAASIGGLALRCDVSNEGHIQQLIARTRERFGRVDAYFSNAGILAMGGLELADPLWDQMWKIHGMAHVWAARALMPEMAARGEGCFVVTASAAGLLNMAESAPYGVSKHASVAFAEWLRMAYGHKGITVSCLCPQAVRTNMMPGDGGSAGTDGFVTPAQVASEVLSGVASGRFLILPHENVLSYVRAKANDHERWLAGMQKLYRLHVENDPPPAGVGYLSGRRQASAT